MAGSVLALLSRLQIISAKTNYLDPFYFAGIVNIAQALETPKKLWYHKSG
jgi:hypothetical protein